MFDLKKTLKKIIPDKIRKFINRIRHIALVDGPLSYKQDGLYTLHNCEFMLDPGFVAAYERGIKAAHGKDFCWHWRVYVGLWVAQNAVKREGDFVECGVGNGFLSSAIMKLGQHR